MGFFNVGRIIGYFFNQLFRWLFWNKTGQKILFAIVIAIILVVFVMLGEVSAAEPDNFASYDEISYDGSLQNTVINGDESYPGQISTLSGYTTFYFELNPYNYYTVSSDVFGSSSVRLAFTNSLDLGSQCYNFHFFGNSDYTFNGNDYSYKYFCISLNTNNYNFNDTVHIYYNAFPYEVSKLNLPGWTNLGTVGYMYRYNSGGSLQGNSIAFPIAKGFSYRLINTATSSFGFVTNLDFINSSSDRDWHSTSNTTGTTSSEERIYYSTFSGTINSDRNCVDFVAPDSGYLIMTDFGNLDEKLFASSLDTSVVNSSSSVNQNINQSTSAINDVNNSLTDSSISDNNDDYILPESGVNDIADSGFANIFDKLRTAFTRESSGQGLVVQVPFTDKSFTISKNTVFGSANLGIVGTLINSFWYFLVSLWIVKDIAHKMNLIKSGNIELAQTSNIKEDLL